MTAATIVTTVGTADVLHRLALAVETVDAVTARPVRVRTGREVPPRLRPPGADASWPCLDLESNGRGRAVLRHGWSVPGAVTVRLVDPARRFVPRRVRVPLWTLAEVEAVEAPPPAAGSYVPTRSRLLRPWLLPGAGYPLPRGTTAVRGRLTLGGAPVRWARVVARGPGNARVGWGHGDERGEFVVVVAGTGTLAPPAPSTMGVSLTFTAPPQSVPTGPPPADDYTDLVVEAEPRSAAPPAAADLVNDLLRGLAVPPGYAPSSAPATQVVVDVGSVTTLPTDIAFTL